MQNTDFDEVVDAIATRDPRFHRAAYAFLRDALDHTQQRLAEASTAPPHKPGRRRRAVRSAVPPVPERHVTGPELLEGIRAYALEQFGPFACLVFDEWGIHRCEDFGEIVFNMVEHRLLRKTDTDSRDDFKGGYDFKAAFVEPFRPVRVRPPAGLSEPATSCGGA